MCKNKATYFIIFISAILLISNLSYAIDVWGTIDSNTVWPAATYDLTGPIYIDSATLTIQPGAIVNLNSYYIRTGDTYCNNPGHLIANGATFLGSGADKYITFCPEGSTGYITNCSLSNVYINCGRQYPTITGNTITSVEYPIRMEVGSSPSISGNDLSGCSYPGIGIYGTLEWDWSFPDYSLTYYLYSSLSVDNCTMTISPGLEIHLLDNYIRTGDTYCNNPGHLIANGATFLGSGADKYITFCPEGSTGYITNCSLSNVYINCGRQYPTITGNTITSVEYPIRMEVGSSPSISGNDLSGCTYPGIGISGTLRWDWSFPDYSLIYYLTGSIYVDTCTMTIPSGLTIHLRDSHIRAGNSSCTRPGHLNANGATFLGSGADKYITFCPEGSTGYITNCSLSNVYINCGRQYPTITGNIFSNLNIAIRCPDLSIPTIINNSFCGNNIALQNNGDETIDARYNWWGDISGPYHDSLNPSGQGETVVGPVDFDPWLLSGCDEIPPIPVFLVHGYSDDAASWNTLLNWLQNNGFKYVYAVDNIMPCGVIGETHFSGNAALLADFINQKISELETELQVSIDTINIIGHSMGGLIARRYVSPTTTETTTWTPKNVKHLVMLGTPNKGSNLADIPGANLKCPDGPAYEELDVLSMYLFNKDFKDDTLNTNYYSFWGYRGYCLPVPCRDCYGGFPGIFLFKPNDGAVSRNSAVRDLNNGLIFDPIYTNQHGNNWCHSGNNSYLEDEDFFLDYIAPILLNIDPFNKEEAKDESMPDIPPQITYEDIQSIDAGTSLTDSFFVEANNSLSVVMFSSDSLVAFSLESSMGEIYDSTITSPDSSQVYFSDVNQKGFYIENAAEGYWHWAVNALVATTSPVEFMIMSSCDNSVMVTVEQNLEYIQQSDTLHLLVTINDDSIGVSGLSVTAQQIWNGIDILSPIVFFDDGLHGDLLPNDGTYGALITDFGSGEVEYKINVTGTAPSGNINRIVSLYAYAESSSNSITGHVYYYNVSKTIPNVVVNITPPVSTPETTDVSGYYSFEVPSADTYSVDAARVDDDPGVSVADIIKIRRHLAYLEVFDTPYKLVASDVNLSGSVSVADVIKLRRYLARLDSLNSGNWTFIDSGFDITNSNWSTAPQAIDVSTIDQDANNTSFIGVRMGDVNDTWSPVKAAKPSKAIAKSVMLKDVYGIVGNDISMPMYIESNTEIAGIELHLKYDTDNLDFTKKISELPGELTINAIDDAIHIVWEDINNTFLTEKDKPIVQLHFNIKDDFESESEIEITRAEIVDKDGEPYNLNLTNGKIIKGGYSAVLPDEYRLEQNRPNPFNPVTDIRFSLPEACNVRLEIFNIMGQRVETLVNEHLEAGYHASIWNACRYASGIYFTRLRAGTFMDTKKMILLK